MRKGNVYFGDGGLDWRNGVSDCIALYYHRNLYLVLHNVDFPVHQFMSFPVVSCEDHSSLLEVSLLLRQSLVVPPDPYSLYQGFEYAKLEHITEVLRSMDELSIFYDLDRFLVCFFGLTDVKRIYAV